MMGWAEHGREERGRNQANMLSYHVQGDSQLLCDMDMAEGGRVGNDGLGGEGLGRGVPRVLLSARLVGGEQHLEKRAEARMILYLLCTS